jgi:hypothetical protein
VVLRKDWAAVKARPEHKSTRRSQNISLSSIDPIVLHTSAAISGPATDRGLENATAHAQCVPAEAEAVDRAAHYGHSFEQITVLSRSAPPNAPAVPNEALQTTTLQLKLTSQKFQDEITPAERAPHAQPFHQAVQSGIASPSASVPFAAHLQAAFGRHDLSGVQAHLGSQATASASTIQALAYATGNHMVFAGIPTLHTVAHEAAHIVQQRRVRLASGIGQVGDAYEQHADAVAEQVVAGQSAEHLLDHVPGAGDGVPTGAGSLQLRPGPRRRHTADLRAHARHERARLRQQRREARAEARNEERRARAAAKRDPYRDDELPPPTAELPRAGVLELGAGEGAFSKAFQQEFTPNNPQRYVATDIGGEQEVVDATMGNSAAFLSSAKAQQLRTQHGVDANRLGDQFRPDSADVIIAANPHGGGQTHPGVGYGLMAYTGRKLEDGTAERLPDPRALQEARDVLKDNMPHRGGEGRDDGPQAGQFIFRGRSNVLHDHLNQQRNRSEAIPAKLNKTNPYLNVKQEHLHELARLGFQVEVQPAQQPQVDRDQVGGGVLDTPQRTVQLGEYNTQIGFTKSDEPPSVTYLHGDYRHSEQSVSNTPPRYLTKDSRRQVRPHQRLTRGKAQGDLQDAIDAGYDEVYATSEGYEPDDPNYSDDDFDLDDEEDSDDSEADDVQLKAATSNAAPHITVGGAGYSVQRKFTSTQQQEYDFLERQPAGPDEGLRKRAIALLQDLSQDKGNDQADTNMVKPLIGKFSAGKGKPANQPNPQGQQNSWKWTDDQKRLAGLLFTAKQQILQAARQIRQRQGDPASLPVEGAPPSQPPVVVQLFEYLPDQEQGGLGLWTGLVQALRQVQAANSLHIVRFTTIDGEQITVRLSHHLSHGAQQADYFVHDARARLVMTPAMGVQQERVPPEVQQQLATAGDTLDVSYKAFRQKIELIKRELGVADPVVARWLLLIIMSPSVAPAAIRRQAPECTRTHLDFLYELVATWMLAEPVRHTSSMLSGIMELELIEIGQRTFEQALVGIPGQGPTHPMAHIGSESQGRDAERAEQAINARAAPSPINTVTRRQTEQLTASYGEAPGAAELGLRELVQFYTQVVEQILASFDAPGIETEVVDTM